MKNKNENNTNYKYKLNILISLCLILLIIICILIAFILFDKLLNQSNEEVKDFIDNISLDVTLNDTKEIDVTIKETNLDVDVFISRVESSKLKYDFEDNLNNKSYYLYFDDETSTYVSNISNLDYSNNEVVSNYINDLFETYIENYLFYESKLNNLNLNNLNYSLIESNKLLIKDSYENYLLINDYGLIIEEKLNNSSLNGNYKFAN
ncbi:MAG: hypothetical protein MSS77_05010 [Mollicutes bacterium]|nr:hypothetical protein [Mollicutes bacterium]